MLSTAVLSAASITPPVAPNITAAPVDAPSGRSNSPSGRLTKLMPARLTMRENSRVVSATSTSGYPEAFWSSRFVSNFLAVHGMIDTTKISLGSIPFFLAYQVFAIAPNICCGDLQLERLGKRSGKLYSQNLIQPGEQEVIIGSTPPF